MSDFADLSAPSANLLIVGETERADTVRVMASYTGFLYDRCDIISIGDGIGGFCRLKNKEEQSDEALEMVDASW